MYALVQTDLNFEIGSCSNVTAIMSMISLSNFICANAIEKVLTENTPKINAMNKIGVQNFSTK